tara:strand:+ start:454 stop:738 length:285 start_codon:yes stop_codon:yes gene_type:complete
MSKRTYKENLEDKGLSKTDGSYDIAYAVEKCHEAFTLLSDEHRLIIQDMWGVKFVAELERFGRYANKQSSLVQALNLFPDVDIPSVNRVYNSYL